jgi:hypothetical protein
MSVARCAFP